MSARRGRGGLIPLTDEFVAYAYKRVSSDDQEKDGMSLPVQDKELLAEIARHETWTFGGSFQDVQTGTNPTRADYQRMLAAARAATAAGKRVVITVVRQNRLGRDGEEALRAWKEFDRLDAQLWATRDGGHLADPLMYGVRAILAEHDVRQISENVKGTFAEIRANGWLKPGRPRWGYRWEPATTEQRQLQGSPMVVPVPHPIEAEYVRELFLRRARGETIRALSTWVRSLPVAARGEVRRHNGSMSPRELSVSAVKDVLDSPVYIARNPEPGQDALDAPVGKWEPLCDDVAWRAIHPRTGARENVVSTSARGQYVLTGFLFCELCGARMCGQLQRGARRVRPGRRDTISSDTRVYICTSRMAGASHGTKPCYRTIKADLIEGQILGILGTLLDALKEPGVREAVRKAARDLESRDAATGDARRLRNAEQDRAALVAERVGLTRTLSAGIITGEAYAEAVAVISAGIDAQAAEIARLTALQVGQQRRMAERPAVDVILDTAEDWAWMLREGAVEDQRAFLKLVLERATPKRLKPGKYQAGMHYTGLGWQVIELGAAVLPLLGRVEDVQRVWAHCTASTRPDEALAAAS